jgi:hypothetical protein
MGLALKKAGLEAPPRAAVAVARPKTAFRTIRERFSKGEVEWSIDLERVKNLPRRPKPEMESIIKDMTARLKKPEGTQTLREIQAWALFEAPRAGGLIALAQTGAGKSLLLTLMTMVFQPVQNPDGTWRPIRAVYFIPPSLRHQFLSEWDVYAKHWKMPNLAGGRWFVPGLPVLHVVPYSQLSSPKSSALVEQIKPDLVLADECSTLASLESSRGIRMRRFMGNFPDCRFIGADATIVSDSVEDFWMPLLWALDMKSPVPVVESEMRRWARAIDPASYEDGYFMPGKLMTFCEAGESVRSGFQRRLADTEGIVMTRENALGIPLYFVERRPPAMPDEIKKFLANLRREKDAGGWRRPDGEEFVEMTQVAACKKQLAEGCYMRWRFPRGEPDEVIEEWFSRRQNWNRELRAKMGRPEMHLDSRKLCWNAAARWFDGGCPGCQRGPEEPHANGCRERDEHPLWDSQTFIDWRKVKHTVQYVQETVWVSDWLLKDAAAWMKQEPGIVWVDHPEFGRALEKLTGCRYYGGGDEANKSIAEEFAEVKGLSDRSIICSVAANFRGKNLQHSFSRCLVVSFPKSNEIVEQMIGRVFREGQKADKVVIDYYAHISEIQSSIDDARETAKFVWQTTGLDQKLRFGQFVERAA